MRDLPDLVLSLLAVVLAGVALLASGDGTNVPTPIVVSISGKLGPSRAGHPSLTLQVDRNNTLFLQNTQVKTASSLVHQLRPLLSTNVGEVLILEVDREARASTVMEVAGAAGAAGGKLVQVVVSDAPARTSR